MSFKLFIYYCALCGGWAAVLTAGLVLAGGLRGVSNWAPVASGLIAALLGLLVAGVVGMLDALMNSSGIERFLRVFVCLGVGLVGGFAGGFVGEALFQTALQMQPDNTLLQAVMHVVGWSLVGMVCGIAIAVYDVLQGLSGKGMGSAFNKLRNGIAGGLLGGLVGGLFFALLSDFGLRERLPRFPLATGLTIVGLCIGLFIGLAQVILKEAWVKVESGFRAGRELILSKPETVVGRAEGCDIGLFGDNQVEKQHARIVQKNNRYYVEDTGTSGGTWLNEQRIADLAPLRSGDAIRVGKCVLRFGERAKRK